MINYTKLIAYAIVPIFLCTGVSFSAQEEDVPMEIRKAYESASGGIEWYDASEEEQEEFISDFYEQMKRKEDARNDAKKARADEKERIKDRRKAVVKKRNQKKEIREEKKKAAKKRKEEQRKQSQEKLKAAKKKMKDLRKNFENKRK